MNRGAAPRTVALKLVDCTKTEPSEPDTCAYCIPPETRDEVSGSECLIKHLGTSERHQIARVLRKAGIQEHTFTTRCPLAHDNTFGSCPFYESVADIDEE